MASISGSANRKDGSKVNGTMTVSTSWNSNKAYPKNGSYTLDLGSNPKSRVTVYVDGMKYTEIHVDGSARVNIVA